MPSKASSLLAHVSAKAEDIIVTITKLMSCPPSQRKRSSSYPVPFNAA